MLLDSHIKTYLKQRAEYKKRLLENNLTEEEINDLKIKLFFNDMMMNANYGD